MNQTTGDNGSGTNTILIVLVIIIVLVGGYFLFMRNDTPAPMPVDNNDEAGVNVINVEMPPVENNQPVDSTEDDGTPTGAGAEGGVSL